MSPPPEPPLPRIAIERSPANDVYLILSMLGSGPEAERAVTDPLALLRDNRAEARFVARYLKGRLDAAAGPPPSAPPGEPTSGGAPTRRRAGVAQELRRASSLLR